MPKVPQEPGTSRTRPHGWDCQGTQSRPQACPRQGRRLQAGKGSVGLPALLQGLWGAMLVAVPAVDFLPAPPSWLSLPGLSTPPIPSHPTPAPFKGSTAHGKQWSPKVGSAKPISPGSRPGNGAPGVLSHHSEQGGRRTHGSMKLRQGNSSPTVPLARKGISRKTHWLKSYSSPNSQPLGLES